MCRNIKPLFNFAPPATREEIEAAALQFVRKVAGTRKPSQANTPAFEAAVDQVADAVAELFAAMVTSAEPRNREVEAQKARLRSAQRFGQSK